jgi:hypothetical protein
MLDPTLAELRDLLLELYGPERAFEWLFAPNEGMCATVPIARMESRDQTFEIVKHLRRERDVGDDTIIRRGEIIGQRVDKPDASEAEHFTQCATCDGYFDMRDLGQVMEHEGPLPHPTRDKPQ